MISRSEIEAAAQRFDIHTSNVQRDYVHGWILSRLFSRSQLSGSLVLKGGNAFRKGYFEDSRYSRDLDFSTGSRISPEDLGRELNQVCAETEASTGVRFDLARTRVEPKRNADEEKQISEARLYFEDFYGVDSEVVLSVRLDVTQFDRIHLPVQQRQLIHPYSDQERCSSMIRCVKLEELLASKMRCLLQRKHIADLFDLVYGAWRMETQYLDRRELLATFFRMTVFGSSPGVLKGLFLDLPLEALGRFWNSYVLAPLASRFSFSEALDGFLALVEDMLPGEPERNRSDMFFPSKLRNPIMEAADSLTMLRLRYSNVTRLVEPYSLEFRTRLDGRSGEYLYVYDNTGGSTGPGIKCLVPGRVQGVENTVLPFTPRFEVQLRKAGGAERASAFRSGPRGYSGFGGTRYRPAAKYEVTCDRCLKRFRRRRRTSRIRPHADRYGYPCPGRSGSLS